MNPPLVPSLAEEPPLYFVLCDYGPQLGMSYYEASPEKSDRQAVITWLRQGQYTNPQRVIEVDLSGGTARDVTEEMFEAASELEITD